MAFRSPADWDENESTRGERPLPPRSAWSGEEETRVQDDPRMRRTQPGIGPGSAFGPTRDGERRSFADRGGLEPWARAVEQVAIHEVDSEELDSEELVDDDSRPRIRLIDEEEVTAVKSATGRLELTVPRHAALPLVTPPPRRAEPLRFELPPVSTPQRSSTWTTPSPRGELPRVTPPPPRPHHVSPESLEDSLPRPPQRLQTPVRPVAAPAWAMVPANETRPHARRPVPAPPPRSSDHDRIEAPLPRSTEPMAVATSAAMASSFEPAREPAATAPPAYGATSGHGASAYAREAAPFTSAPVFDRSPVAAQPAGPVEVTPPPAALPTSAPPPARAPLPRSAWTLATVLAGASVVLSVALTVFFLLPKSGRLRIDLRGDGASAHSEIFVDGRKVCDTAPCIVSDLPTGARTIQVISSTGATASMVEMVEAGRERAALVVLPNTTSPRADYGAEASHPVRAREPLPAPAEPVTGVVGPIPVAANAAVATVGALPDATGARPTAAPAERRDNRSSAPASPPPAPRAAAPRAERPVDPEPPAAAAPASGTGTLNANSLPPSKVLVDGRPMGATPKVEIPLSAGTHTVTFVHPDLGKKSVSVTIKAGQSATASVRFKK